MESIARDEEATGLPAKPVARAWMEARTNRVGGERECRCGVQIADDATRVAESDDDGNVARVKLAQLEDLDGTIPYRATLSMNLSLALFARWCTRFSVRGRFPPFWRPSQRETRERREAKEKENEKGRRHLLQPPRPTCAQCTHIARLYGRSAVDAAVFRSNWIY